MQGRTQDQMTTQPEVVDENEQWITVADAKRQAADYILAHLPDEPDVGGDCETCRVIKGMAAGLVGDGDGQV
jgi:microcystin degradation protein MlrC